MMIRLSPLVLAIALLMGAPAAHAQVVTCTDPGGFPVCNGLCPAGFACVNTGTACDCTKENLACEGAGAPTCDGSCPDSHACQPFSSGCQCVLVPTLSEWGIISMSLLMLGGVMFMRRRYHPSSRRT